VEHQRRDLEGAIDRGHKRGRTAHAADPKKVRFVEATKADKTLERTFVAFRPDGTTVERTAPRGVAIGVHVRPRPGLAARLEVDAQEVEDAVAQLVADAHDQIAQGGPDEGELVVVVPPSLHHLHVDANGNPNTGRDGVHVKAWFLWRPKA
jgi:hypothetical protein